MAKFCGKCGNPIEHCTCYGTAPAVPETHYPSKPARVSYSTVAHLDEMALGEGEQIVKTYILGKYPFGCGNVQLLVTNKRVILKESYSFLFLSHSRLEELNLESVHGLNGNIGRGMNKVIFIIGLALFFVPSLIGMLLPIRIGGPFLPILGLIIMALSCIFPYMTFGITGMGSEHQALMTGINVNGKNLLNNGVVLQARPTADARKSIAEAGACIFDLRTRGDEAIEKWKSV